ncbi:MAG: hypothetical protein FWD57_17310, partial [Polyangiaceae bacterium]|nr:hypothetical protein [Polyangiaceae bacterium]
IDEAQKRKPALALLVGFTSFNQQLGARLRARGTRVLWCVAPQVWAWRPSRLKSLRRSVDRLAVILPFEEAIWQQHGYDVRYVGHPAFELVPDPRLTAEPMTVSESGRCSEGHAQDASPVSQKKRLVVLMGSREQEVRALAGPFLGAACIWRKTNPTWEIRSLISPSLPPSCESWLIGQINKSDIEYDIADSVWGAAPVLGEYGLALCASGTACLEAVLAGVPPVIGYRCDWITALLARLLLRTEHIGLPNILFGEGVFPELVQEDLRPGRVVDALSQLAGSEAAMRACFGVRDALRIEDGCTFGERVAAMLAGM